MAKIYVSSTFSDLQECRAAVYGALRKMKHDVVAMEDYVATHRRPLDKCLADVEACDIYVGIFAWRYGFIPETDNAERKGITELEYQHALKIGKECLLFLLHEDAPWPHSKTEKGDGYTRITQLREELGKVETVSFFHTREELAGLVGAAVANWVAAQSQAIPKQPANSIPEEQQKISIARLPVTGPDLFGREAELKLLDEAWANPNTNIVTFVAWGGVGKSALVNTWLARLAKEQYRGAERVYAWSFYSQGTSDERAASADLFIESALRWFGDEDPTKGSPWDKGERLADLIRRTRTLLVLDGLEPLQQPPNWAGLQEGKLKDQALQALLRELAAQQRGLCVVSTRLKISDLEDFERNTVVQADLDTLAPQAGAQILRAQRVAGDDAELETASAEFGGHSLALTLLGSYLADVCGGDIRRRGEIGNLEEDERHGGHARRVMAAYEKWLGEGPELAVLRLLGLFDRPAPADAIAVLRAAPVIPGLTDALQNLSETKWQQTLSKLRRIKLLAGAKSGEILAGLGKSGEGKSAGLPRTSQDFTRLSETFLDAHPLVREHFGHQLRQRQPDAWREANNRLYEHLKRTAKELPETVEEMSPLFAAVAHGCAAGRHQEAFDDVYRERIHRRNELFSIKRLGVYGADLAALSAFFATPWQQPVDSLDETAAAFLLHQAGFDLHALGRLTEATRPLQAALDVAISQAEAGWEHAWEHASSGAGNLSRLWMNLGDLSASLRFAQQSLELAKRSDSEFHQVSARALLADVEHQAGRLTEAAVEFNAAEAMQQDEEPEFPLLYSISGFGYCELLLSLGQFQEVQIRAAQLLKDEESVDYPLNIALYKLVLGRAWLLQFRQAGAGDYGQVAEFLHQAVDGLRQAGRIDDLPRGLLARAEWRRLAGAYPLAQADLAEAQRIAERGEMGLHLCDCHLEWARLWLAQGDPTRAREHWATAKAMVERMGYHRRDDEVAELAQQLG
jgi:tetratricopeptide (TPR) repeat protein